MSSARNSSRSAIEAVRRGYQPIPVRTDSKKPGVGSWTKIRWDPGDEEHVTAEFEQWANEGMANVGLLCGEPSGDLMDVDVDHPRAMRLKDYFLPRTAMRSGRPSRPNSHYWYRAKRIWVDDDTEEDGGRWESTLPGTRRHKMPRTGGNESEVSVELRSTLSQTLIPPSIHDVDLEEYRWEGEPWGGDTGPLEIDGRKLAVQVALLGLGTVLIDNWPHSGGRHDAYLALAGGLLRNGDEIHPFWEKNVAVLIGAMADATNDDDGPEARISETVDSTIDRLRAGREAVGFTRLAEIIGEPHVRQARIMAAEVETSAGFITSHPVSVDGEDMDRPDTGSTSGVADLARAEAVLVPDSERDPLGERVASWEPVDLDPYLAGTMKVPEPSICFRDDGQGLMYGGRVNMLYGSSESAKSWIALTICLQEIEKGERVMFLDLEDEPVQTLDRLMRLGAGPDDIRTQFTYLRPEEPLAPMQRNKWGAEHPTDLGQLNQRLFEESIRSVDPALIVVDGMTVLYGLHGLDSNDAVSTDVITGWLKKLTRNGRSTVIIIDHTTKNADKGTLPIGSQHKVAMVQGTLMQVWPIRQPVPGQLGEIELVVLKDRPGAVRAISERTGTKAQVAASILMDSTGGETTVMTIGEPTGKSGGPTVGADGIVEVDLTTSRRAEQDLIRGEWEDRVKRAFGGEEGRTLGMREVQDALADYGEPGQVLRAVKRLVPLGYLRAEGSTRDRVYVFQIGVEGFDSD